MQNVMDELIIELQESELSFEESSQAIRMTSVKNQKVIKVILAAIGQLYVSLNRYYLEKKKSREGCNPKHDIET